MSTIGTFREASRFHGYTQFAAARGKRGSLVAVAEWIEAKLELRRSRRALLEMTDDQLKDIGLSRSQAHEEAYRPTWK
jgi:uncharacterized protein YjiS (DUF1127 family)